ncbi:MAG: class I SAM-dependent methyltransferase [Methanomicrobiales archaeon]|nr:class I SAM-dependent methyltransferase [Methanomicrobiales archaeon]
MSDLNMTTTYHNNPGLWADFWQEAIQEGVRRGPMNPGFWNHMAGKYERNKDLKRESERLETIFNLLKSTGIKLDGARVLDIGGGTGALAIPLAKSGARVTVVDFSEGMLQKLKERAQKEQVPIERTILSSWDAIDLEKEGFKKQFDIVLASMTPAVRTPDDFRLMLEASKGVCYYSGWVKRKWSPEYYELYRDLFHEEHRDGTHGIYLPFMYLYMLGYQPDIVLKQDEWQSEETLDEIVETVSGFFGVTKHIDEDKKTKIREYFARKTDNGVYHSKTMVTTGMMVWDMRKNCNRDQTSVL